MVWVEKNNKVIKKYSNLIKKAKTAPQSGFHKLVNNDLLFSKLTDVLVNLIATDELSYVVNFLDSNPDYKAELLKRAIEFNNTPAGQKRGNDLSDGVVVFEKIYEAIIDANSKDICDYFLDAGVYPYKLNNFSRNDYKKSLIHSVLSKDKLGVFLSLIDHDLIDLSFGFLEYEFLDPSNFSRHLFIKKNDQGWYDFSAIKGSVCNITWLLYVNKSTEILKFLIDYDIKFWHMFSGSDVVNGTRCNILNSYGVYNKLDSTFGKESTTSRNNIFAKGIGRRELNFLRSNGVDLNFRDANNNSFLYNIVEKNGQEYDFNWDFIHDLVFKYDMDVTTKNSYGLNFINILNNKYTELKKSRYVNPNTLSAIESLLTGTEKKLLSADVMAVNPNPRASKSSLKI